VKITALREQIRATPAGAKIGLQLSGATGVVVEGPAYKEKQNWWRVDFAAGADGWVRESTIGAN
jgi:hypothetical protein